MLDVLLFGSKHGYLFFQNPLMLVGVNGGLLDGIVELLEHCLIQVCSFILVFCYVFQVCSNEHVKEIM